MPSNATAPGYTGVCACGHGISCHSDGPCAVVGRLCDRFFGRHCNGCGEIHCQWCQYAIDLAMGIKPRWNKSDE